MKRKIWLFALVALPLAAGCGRADRGRAAGADAAEPAAAPAATSAAGAKPGAAAPAATAAAVVYVDVRTPEEYAASHVEGALNIPYDQMEARAGELDGYRGRHIVLYCRTGHRAGIAYDVLKGKGFEDIENGGGLEALAGKGLPVTGS